MSELQQKVDNSAGFYTHSFLGFDFQLAEFGYQTIKPFFKGKTALELGPASGYMTKELVKDFETLHLVEGSAELLSQIPDYPNVTKFHSMFENFDHTQQYDTIVMSHVLEHVADPVPVLKKIKTWLKSDGVFVVSVPNAKSIHRVVAVEMGLLKDVHELNARDHELGHYRVYDTALLLTHLREAGFTIEHNGGYFLKPVSNGQIENNWTPEMIQGFYKASKHYPDSCAEIFAVCKK